MTKKKSAEERARKRVREEAGKHAKTLTAAKNGNHRPGYKKSDMIGKEWVILKKLDELGVITALPTNYEKTSVNEKGVSMDSRILRMGREWGFVHSAEDARELEIEVIQKTVENTTKDMANTVSHNQDKVSALANLECFALATMRPHYWCVYLEEIDAEFAKPEGERRVLPFKGVPHFIALAYAKTMRGVQDAKGNQLGKDDYSGHMLKNSTIKTRLANIAGIMKKFGESGDSLYSPQLTSCMAEWADEDETVQAPAFDMHKDMMKAFDGMTAAKWTSYDKLRYWSLLLVQICCMGRTSCMTEYAPTLEDISLPAAAEMWDTDGLPKYINVGWRDWKSRKKSSKNKLYNIMLWRNHLDPRFCPVTWLMCWIKYSGLKSGKVWGAMCSDLWTRKLAMFYGFMGKPECTPHSIRRTAAQWAARCGDMGWGPRNAGRWRNWGTVMIYIAQGSAQARNYPEGKDPILTTWFFKPVTSGGDGEQDDM